MVNDWLGAPFGEAQFVFLLPNYPILPEGYLDSRLDSQSLIQLNGNHWRKILTIMAKLTVLNEKAWREQRDNGLFKYIAMVFSVQQLDKFTGKVFIVGNVLREILPVPDSAKVIGFKQLCYVESNYVWCPYLDYRQFPNDLISMLRINLLK